MKEVKDLKEKVIHFMKGNIVSVISVILAIISYLILGYYVMFNSCPVCEECEDCSNREEIIAEEKIKVDIKGAIKKPGVYELNKGSVVFDAITIAGGLTASGVTTNINLSKKLSDEMVIYVFTKKELDSESVKNEVVCEIPKCECEVVSISNCDSIENSPISDKVSINDGTLEELMTLDGIGESKAKSIIEYRENNGKFNSLDEIKNVSGIGDAAYEKIKDKIKL